MTDPEQPEVRRNEREQTIQRRERISESGSQDMYCIKSFSLFCSMSRNANSWSSTTERQQVFHLFFLELVSVGRLLLFMLKPVMSPSSSPLALPSVQGLDR